MSILLSLVPIIAMVCAFAVTSFTHRTTTHAASPTTATYQGKALKGSQTTISAVIPTKVIRPHRSFKSPVDLDAVGPKDNAVIKANSKYTTALPKITGMAIPGNTEGRLLHNFNGLSDKDQAALIGGEVTPPDQGLCVGHDFTLPGDPTVVLEPLNLAIAEYTPFGRLLFSQSLYSLFNDPFATGDVSCFYDAQNKAFYFSEIGFDPTGAHTVDDIAVFDHNGFTGYQFDSSLGGNCFGDQPHVGYDNYDLFIATDEFCGPLENNYEGALLIAISKSQLLQEAASPNAVEFGPLVLGGVPIVTLQPAISAGLETEYLLNSFPNDQFGNHNSIVNTLGFWQVKGGPNITSGHGTVTLNGRIIASESYAFPQLAASTGNGSVTTVSGYPITSEAFLNPGDDRMMQVQAVKNGGHVELYAALNTAINIAGDPSARDGVAWFSIDASSYSLEGQGYVAAAGSYMLYPTIFHANSGTTTIVFSITSPTLNPSSGYVVMNADTTKFGAIKITGAGAGPHVSFSDALFSTTRWGRYTASALDPSGNGIWSAAEYIPPVAGQDPLDNWGTNVFEVAGN